MMEFNELVVEKIHWLLTKNGLLIAEQRKNFVRYDRKDISISFSHNPLENSYDLFVERGHFSTTIDNCLLREHFHCDLQLSNVPRDVFIANALLFFEGEGGVLLAHEQAWAEFEKFVYKRADDYMAKLLYEQDLAVANKAWAEKNYALVIKFLEKIGTNNLSGSLLQKYKIARKKVDM